KLPPLRADARTLMVGRLKETDTFSMKIDGNLAGQPTTVFIREKIAKPENDNFFLVSLLAQWSKAEARSAPALISAERALAYGEQQTLLTQEEYMTQAHWALADDKVDVAEKLFGLAAKVNPHDAEAANGLAVVKKLKEGSLTQKRLHAEIAAAK